MIERAAAPEHGVYLVVGLIERLTRGFGDGDTLPVCDTPAGKPGVVIWSENYMPRCFTIPARRFADLDPGEVAEGKFDPDVAGHYARPDVFRLEANERVLKRRTTRSNRPCRTPRQG